MGQSVWSRNRDHAMTIKEYNGQAREDLREITRQSPREHGYESSLWKLEMLAEVSYQKELAAHQVHKDTVSQTLMDMGVNWIRAKHWINSPDEHYGRKKASRLAKGTGCQTGRLVAV